MNEEVNTNIELSIIVVLYNSSKFLDGLIDSLLRQKLSNKKVEIVFIGYEDGNKKELLKIDKLISKNDLLHKTFEINLVRKKTNRGFGWGCNLGAKLAKGEYLLFLNPDVILKDPLLLQKTLKFLKMKKGAIIGALTYSLEDNKKRLLSFRRRPNFYTFLFEFTNLKKLWPNNPYSRHFNFLDANVYDLEKECLEVDSVSGSFLSIAKKDFYSIGMFDTNFFLYLEDLDLCLRWRNNKKLVYMCPELKIYHYGGGSSRMKERINVEAWIDSRLLFVNKHVHNILERLLLRLIFFFDSWFIRIRSSYKNVG